MYTDSHCHLDPGVYGSDEAVDAVIERARAAGVTRLVTIGAGYGAETAEEAVRVAARHDDVWCTVGLHPHDAQHWSPELRDRLVALAQSPRCVGFGEMGLDFFYDNSPRDVQRTCLREQIDAALEVQRPIVIHDRDSDGEVLRILVERGAFEGAGVLWHCFTGDVHAMHAIVERGGFVSIPGIVTFKAAEGMREVARQAPLDRLLVETDSPFLTPVPFRGKQNEPARVALVADFVAGLRGIEPAALAAATTENTRRFFGLA